MPNESPSTIQEWQQKWGLPDEVIRDLESFCDRTVLSKTSDRSEAGIQTERRLRASKRGERLWRNNVGAYQTPEGAWVRYGLANDSKVVNAQIKSSDLIGIRPVKITSDMVGTTIGQFIAEECKAPGWKLTKGDKRAQAQLRFITLINSMGGDAKFVNEVEA